MLKLGILKSSRSKSLSKPMHLSALEKLNLNGEYEIYECLPEDLKETFEKLKKEGVRGLNVTIPHKVSIIPFLDKLTERAKLINAVNTIIFNDSGTIGENTDLTGFFSAIPEKFKKDIRGKEISMIGYGGAGSAIAYSFLMNDIKKLNIYGRNLEKLKNFKSMLKNNNFKSEIVIDTMDKIDLSNTYILTNTTPIGMYPDIDSSPVRTEDLKKLPKSSLVYDIIYNPSKTKLLKEVEALGLETLNGIDMLVLQGAESLKLWTGKENIPVDVMKKAVLENL